jgi:PAS domain S-box-containing protein
MHKLLSLQLKKCFGKEWETLPRSPEFEKLIALVDESYTQHDEDYRMLERTLDVSSAELTDAIQEIKKGHELLHSVTESIHDMIFYKDLDFKYIGLNHSCSRFFGKNPEDFIGKDDFDLFPAEHAIGFRQRDTLIFETLTASTDEEWVKNARGEDVLFLTTKHPLINTAGEFIGLVGISRDITHEYRLEKEIKEQQALLTQQSRLAAMGEMIGNIAHQWRQPINALGLMIQDIEEAYRFGELDKEYIGSTTSKAMDQIRYMSSTIDDFRNFFNPDKDKRYFSLYKSIHSAKNILTHGVMDSSIQCTIAIPEEIIVYGYKTEFAQVIFNLISNARDALMSSQPLSAWIKINARTTSDTVEISVRDNGGGIPPDILDRIFDPYFTTKEEGKGSGIGLYMAKKIIERHMEGTLKARNTKDGVCFTILLPLPAPPER